jgi:hypothetical protein
MGMTQAVKSSKTGKKSGATEIFQLMTFMRRLGIGQSSRGISSFHARAVAYLGRAPAITYYCPVFHVTDQPVCRWSGVLGSLNEFEDRRSLVVHDCLSRPHILWLRYFCF